MADGLITALRREISRLRALGGDGLAAVLRHTAREVITDRVGLAASGCAFYATLALFPGMSVLISLYGLAFDTATLAPQLARLKLLLPPSAYQLIATWLNQLVTHHGHAHRINLLISLGVGLWSASAGTRSLLGAIRLAYKRRENRGFLHYQAVAMGLTLGNMVGVVACIAALVLLPAGLDLLGVPRAAIAVLRELSLALLLVFVFASLGVLYRLGPGAGASMGHVVTPGALLASLVWLIVSAAFSFYAGHIATYGTLYGPLGAVVGLMMWFYVSAFVVLMGAELNAAMEAYAPRLPGS